MNNKKTMAIQELFKLYQQERLPSETTITNYRSLINVFYTDTSISSIDVNHQDIIRWRDIILKRASITTFNSYLRQMRALFEIAVLHNYLPTNPFKSVKLIVAYDVKPKTLDTATLQKIYQLLDNNEYDNAWFWRIVINIFYTTGVRRRQLVGLKWKDIDFDKQIMRLSAHYSKTKRSHQVPLTNHNVKELLLLYQKSIQKHPELSENDQVFNITLFSDKYLRDHMVCDNVSTFFKSISSKIGVQVSAHRFRHTMATEIANCTGNIKALQEFLGHSNITTTMRYVHPNMENLRTIQKVLQ